MKEMDCVELTVEKEKYIKDGVHQGMQGWICDSRNIDDSWLVNFPQCGENRDIATIAVKENDLKLIDFFPNGEIWLRVTHLLILLQMALLAKADGKMHR